MHNNPSKYPYTDKDGNTKHVLQPMNARPSKNGAWWVPLLEKAYAKFTGTYIHLNGGHAVQALHAFTGMPMRSENVKKLSDNQIWNIVSAADKRNYIMVAGNQKDYAGLVGGHAYTLLGAYEVRDPTTGQMARLFKVRNPWGAEQYRGPWSDKDTSRWTPALKKELGHGLADDGIFFLPLNVFSYSYEDFTIAMYDKNWKRMKVPGDGKPGKQQDFWFTNEQA